MKLKDDYRCLQPCIDLTIRGDSIFILKPVSLLLVVHYNKFRMNKPGVKVQIGWLCYCSYNPAVDNSDSPYIVEQLSQGLSFSCYIFISDSS